MGLATTGRSHNRPITPLVVTNSISDHGYIGAH